MSMCPFADYEDATIALLHRASLTHAVALDVALAAAPFGALLLLSRWSQTTLHQCLKHLIRQKHAHVDLNGPGVESANKMTWRYGLTHQGRTRALALILAGRELWQPPIYSADQQRVVLDDRARRKVSRARRPLMGVR